MKMLAQKLKDGVMPVLEVPIPQAQKGNILVRNYYSLISSGTEGSTVKAARKNLIGKAKERPQQARQVLDTLKSQGPVQTYRTVMKKLDAYSPLGYSCAGEVIDVGLDVRGFMIGDLVACGGKTAAHAEIVCVPANLCVKLSAETDLRQAAYNSLGAIALQGIRQADLRLGETAAVIGLGLLGQITALLLKASGVRVIGIDIDPAMVEIAGKHCLDLAVNRETAGIENRIIQFSDGLGCDAVIITAGSHSLDPINLSGAMSRKKGTIVVVGNVPTGFDREPHFYQKELRLKMSCSYGPGRYDPLYEEKGIDYPPAYVRWTEKRNMAAFQELIYSKKIDLSYLTTHTFQLKNAPKAYDMMLAKSEPFIGILIEYEAGREFDLRKRKIPIKPRTSSFQPSTGVSIGFVGAGSYAQGHLLPNIPKTANIALKGVMTSSGASSRSAAERFGFEFCTADAKDIIENEEINTVFIATRHDSHGEYVLKALNAGKNVFVEKPLCLREDELQKIILAANPHRQTQIDTDESSRPDDGTLSTPSCPRQDASQSTNQPANGLIPDSVTDLTNKRIDNLKKIPLLMVGYNRRFSPFARIIKEQFGKGPMAMAYRINAGAIPADSWIQDPQIGGGRIIGEVCHFVDFMTFLNGSLPVSVYAAAMKDASEMNDTLTISLRYANGSIGNIQYFSNGSTSIGKEYVEIFSNGLTSFLKDFRELETYGRRKPIKKRLLTQDKGQKNEVRIFLDALLKGFRAPIPIQEIVNTSETTFKIIEAIKSGQVVKI